MTHKPGPVVIDVAGTTLQPGERERIAHPMVGGVILFSRNFSSVAQVTELVAEIRRARPGPLMVCVDHEGGRVQRFREGFTAIAPMRELGRRWDVDPMDACRQAAQQGETIGRELRRVGVDLSFTPVLDLDHGPSGVIGDRAFHRDPRVVSLLAGRLMHGLLLGGMGNCGKHFPGHGFVAADSHHAVPVDKRSLKAILADDARPYEWLSTTLTSVMPAHVVYSKVDARPAGFSDRWLKDILRGRLGFTGAIFSDDLSMEGARHVAGRSLLTYAEAAALALDAGCDMVLLCNQSLDGGAAVEELLAGLADEAGRGHWQPDPDSEQRRLALLPSSPPLAWDDLMHDPVYQRALERLP